jgi:hypothetical protein
VSALERLGAWVVTGPLGRLVAFLWDLTAAWGKWAITKLRRP